MASIGERAAQAIRERAAKNDSSIKAVLDEIKASGKILNEWERGRFNPSAYYLQQMLLAGYDIAWILIGTHTDDGKRTSIPYECPFPELEFDYGAED